MKRSILILIVCLAAASCQLDSGISGNRTKNSLKYTATTAVKTGMDTPLNMMYQAFRIDSYIKEDDEGKKDAKYSDISWNITDNIYTIGEKYTVAPDDKSIFSCGSKWRVKDRQGNGEYADYIETDAVKDSCWKVQARVSELEMKCTGTDRNGKVTLDCEVAGTYEKGNEFWASYESNGAVSVWLKAQSSEGNVSYTLCRTGEVGVNFLQNDMVLDWCKLNYSGENDPSATTSQD